MASVGFLRTSCCSPCGAASAVAAGAGVAAPPRGLRVCLHHPLPVCWGNPGRVTSAWHAGPHLASPQRERAHSAETAPHPPGVSGVPGCRLPSCFTPDPSGPQSPGRRRPLLGEGGGWAVSAARAHPHPSPPVTGAQQEHLRKRPGDSEIKSVWQTGATSEQAAEPAEVWSIKRHRTQGPGGAVDAGPRRRRRPTQQWELRRQDSGGTCVCSPDPKAPSSERGLHPRSPATWPQTWTPGQGAAGSTGPASRGAWPQDAPPSLCSAFLVWHFPEKPGF